MKIIFYFRSCKSLFRWPCIDFTTVVHQVKLDELYEQLMRDLRNQRNWFGDAEQQLLNQASVSEDKDALQQQLDEHKVRSVSIF